MANNLKMATANAIVQLWRQGWSYRRIARVLGVHRETVARHVKLAREESKPANPTPGADRAEPAKPANPTPGSSGPKSRCKPFREVDPSTIRRWEEGSPEPKGKHHQEVKAFISSFQPFGESK